MGKTKTIGVLTHRDDTHAYALAWALEEFDVKVQILDTTQLVDPDGGISVVMGTEQGSGAEILLNGEPLEFDLFWMRRLRSIVPVKSEQDKWVRGNYEMTYSAYGSAIADLFDYKFPRVNSFRGVLAASQKLLQMQVARDVGFALPPTMVGARDKDIVAFIQTLAADEFVFKPFRPNVWVFDAGASIATTTRMALGDIDCSYFDGLPGVYQGLVDKQTEYRVTVLFDKVYAMAFRPTEAVAGQVLDWRFLPSNSTSYEPFKLDDETLCKIRKIGAFFGLKCFTMDLASDGRETYFLDLNPSGQFLYCEQFCPSIPMLQYFAEGFAGAVGGALPADHASLSLADYLRSGTDQWQRGWASGEADLHVTCSVVLPP